MDHEQALRTVRSLLESYRVAILTQDKDAQHRLLNQATATINEALEYR